MLRPEHEAQPDALDDALAAQEREIDQLLSSLGTADAPPDLVREVLARISPPPHSAAVQPVHQFARRSVPKRGVTVNKKLMFGLAAAAVVILAVITYTSRPPATTGTEATIGAAQRAQAPQIAASDVQLADQSAQEFLQSEVFDELINDENTRTLLQDASLRESLTDADLKQALEDNAVRAWLRSGDAAKKMLEDSELWRRLDDANYRKNIQDNNAKAALNNAAFVSALKKRGARELFARRGASEALAREQLAAAARHKGFDAALKNVRFGEAMARAYERLQARRLEARPTK